MGPTEQPTAVDDAGHADPVRLRDGVGFSVAVFIGVRVLLSLLAVLTVGTVRPPSSAGSGVVVPATPGWHNAIDGTDRWDAGWFERIAREGYDPSDASAAFFPGYPLAIRAVTIALPLGETGAATLVSSAAFLAALIVLFALTTFEFSVSMAKRTVYWLVHAGDALQPLHAQDAWFRTFELPVVTLGNALWLGVSGVTDPRGIYWTADVLLTVVVLIPLALRWKVLAPPYLMYVLLSLLVILSYPLPERPLLSAPRFWIVLFPAFWAMAALFAGRRFAVTLIAFVVGFSSLAIAFMNWGYVF